MLTPCDGARPHYFIVKSVPFGVGGLVSLSPTQRVCPPPSSWREAGGVIVEPWCVRGVFKFLLGGGHHSPTPRILVHCADRKKGLVLISPVGRSARYDHLGCVVGRVGLPS